MSRYIFARISSNTSYIRVYRVLYKAVGKQSQFENIKFSRLSVLPGESGNKRAGRPQGIVPPMDGLPRGIRVIGGAIPCDLTRGGLFATASPPRCHSEGTLSF